jgi:rhamnosyltransferase
MSWHIDDVPMVKMLLRYRQHESNQFGANIGLKAYLKRIKMIYSGWYRSEVEKIYDVVGVQSSQVFNLDKRFLIRNFYQLRRRNRDVIFLLLMVLMRLF